MMRFARTACVVVYLCLVGFPASPVFAACDPTTEPDKSDIANARATVAANCDCAGAASRGDYVRCAVATADATLQNPGCRGAVKRCAAKSTCGRPGFVTCCRTDRVGRKKCRVKRDVEHCKAPRGGTACVGSVPSCCDACTAVGCAPVTTTTTTPTTTTTTPTTTTTTPSSPCEDGSFGGNCGGTCPTGQGCGAQDTFFGPVCRCFSADQCEGSAPSCGGTCPSGLACGPGYWPGHCGCFDPTLCEGSAPSCGGTCPSGLVCGQIPGQDSCGCSLPNPCGLSAPSCGGQCTGGGVCRVSEENACTCACEPLACPFLTEWGSSGTGDGQFGGTSGLAVDGNGNVFVADSVNNRVQKFTNTGTFLTKWGSTGSADGQFNHPQRIAVDASGNVFVTDTACCGGNTRIQKFDNNGSFLIKWGSAGTGDGQFDGPIGLATDGSGNVFVADTNNNRIQKFDNTGTFLTKWGSLGGGDGQFQVPIAVTVDSSGDVYVVDASRIQRFTNTGTFLLKWGSTGPGDGQFAYRPDDVAADPSSGNIFVADTFNLRIQEFTDTGTFVRKWGCEGSGDGQFSAPVGVAVDANGNVFVFDHGVVPRVQKFTCP